MEEIQKAERVCIRLAQSTINSDNDFQLKKDNSGIFRCYGRVSYYHPIFIPKDHPLAKGIVEVYHKATLHGGIQATTSKVRERFWIPRLRKLVKSIKYKCLRCKMMQPKGLPAPPTSALPTFREEFSQLFATTGVDFAGPLNYKVKKIKKAYITLFSCASTRAVHLKLCTDQSAPTFKHSLKELVARRGVPRLMDSNNAKTFKHTAEWLKTLRLDDDLQNYLASKHIQWRFNLSRAPWWGGFFERLIGIKKTALSESIGKALLTYKELEEALMDVECFMNNRPLTYLNDEFEQRVITPKILIRGEPTTLLKEKAETLETRRMPYLRLSQHQLRKRWFNEYLKVLNEKQPAKFTGNDKTLNNGRIVLIKGNLMTSKQWKLGKIVNKIVGKDGVVRGYKIQTGNSYIVERPTQLIADLEIEQTSNLEEKTPLNPKANTFEPRQRYSRNAKSNANDRIFQIATNDSA